MVSDKVLDWSQNLELNVVIDVIDNAMARTTDSSAIDVISLMLFDIMATMVGIKAKIEAPADHRAVKSLGISSMMQRRMV